LCAARLDATDGIVDMKAYWTSVRSSAEAYYLLAILNSAAALAKITDLQGIGEAGTKRDFASLVWTLPIPEYDEREVLHRDLAAVASRAETVAATVSLTEAKHFVAKRLTRNEHGTVFRVISMRWTEATWFTLVGQKIVA
jgi:hypothetical protein